MDQIKMQADKQIKTNKDVGYTIKCHSEWHGMGEN